GTIDASGGSGDGGCGPAGGAGGGGRVALYATTFNGFDPTAQVAVQGATQMYNGVVNNNNNSGQYAGPGTVFWKDGAATWGRLMVDSGTASGADRKGPVTPLPALGGGAVTAWAAAGGNAWLSAAAPLGGVWLGAWVKLRDASGGALGDYQVLQLDGS